MSLPFSLPYPEHPYPPYWGPQTTHTNFCEEDYVISTYFAEFINTITNLAYIIYATHGILKLRHTHRNSWANAIPLLGLFGVGICSTVFHMTLKNHAELTDSSSMALPTGAVMSQLLAANCQHRNWRILVHLASATTVALVYVVHILMNKPLFHFIVFAAMIAFIGLRTLYLISSRIKDLDLRRKLFRVWTTGAIYFLSGFAFWLIDLAACGTLTRWKRALGLPWGFVLELHGIWHILTAVGAYAFIVLVGYLTSEEVGKDPRGTLDLWPHLYFPQAEKGVSEKKEQ